MEQDRYEVNHPLYIVGLVSLVFSICFILFSLYILPYLLFGWVYNVPEIIIQWVTWFQEERGFSASGSAWAVLLMFLIPGVALGVLSDIASNRIDNKIYGLTEENEEAHQAEKSLQKRKYGDSGSRMGFKLFMIIVVVVCIVALAEWVIISI